MWRGKITLAVGVLLFWLVGYGAGQEPVLGVTKLRPQDCQDQDAMLDVTAARMTFDQQKGSFLFEENVRVRRCGMTIRCDRLRVISVEAGESIQRIIATGHVQVQRGTRRVVAERAEYFAAEQRLVLTGNPRAWDTQEQHEMTGEEIVILLPQDYVMVKRAHVLFHPGFQPPRKGP